VVCAAFGLVNMSIDPLSGEEAIEAEER
jgi:hypothetical protein